MIIWIKNIDYYGLFVLNFFGYWVYEITLPEPSPIAIALNTLLRSFVN